MKNSKSQALKRKLHFEKDEAEGIRDYRQAIKKSKGKERETYKKILPQERKHLKEVEGI